jgi:hypothetical protein
VSELNSLGVGCLFHMLLWHVAGKAVAIAVGELRGLACCQLGRLQTHPSRLPRALCASSRGMASALATRHRCECQK